MNHQIQLFLSLQNSLSHTQPEICLAIVIIIILLSCKGTDAVNDFVNYTCVREKKLFSFEIFFNPENTGCTLIRKCNSWHEACLWAQSCGQVSYQCTRLGYLYQHTQVTCRTAVKVFRTASLVLLSPLFFPLQEPSDLNIYILK